MLVVTLFRWDLSALMRVRLRRRETTPRGGVGVTVSMIVLHPEDEGDTSASCAAAHVSEDCYAMMASGTNAIIVPLHPDMCSEIAECRVPSSVVHGPIVQVLDKGERHLIVAQWTIVAKFVGKSSQVEVYTPKNRGVPRTLAMKNRLPCLSKDLFWEAMHDISAQTTLIAGHPWQDTN